MELKSYFANVHYDGSEWDSIQRVFKVKDIKKFFKIGKCENCVCVDWNIGYCELFNEELIYVRGEPIKRNLDCIKTFGE